MHKLIIREANIEDARLLYDLSNDDDVRRNSINKRKIEWDKHLIWLNNKLKDNNYKIFLFFDDGDFVGQVKFEIENTQATIGISINRNMRGMGYSTNMLSEAIDKLLLLNESIVNFVALIKADNIASIISFKKVGFVYLQDIKIENDVYQKYIFRKD